MSTNITTYQQYLQSAFQAEKWSTGDVVAFVIPLFEEVLSFHDNGMVAGFENPNVVFIAQHGLDIDERATHHPVINNAVLRKLVHTKQFKGFEITGRYEVDTELSSGNAQVSNSLVRFNLNDPITEPCYLPGIRCYEIVAGHHDARSDIFCLGLILASVVMGLDLYDKDELEEFANFRTQPLAINPRIHPAVASVLTEMTELDRSRRSPDLHELIQRLKYYRDYDPQLQADLGVLAGFTQQKPQDRKSFILSKLRARLFDTSRRNRLLYYKSNNKFVNLTVSSVPMVMHYQSINPHLICSWNKEIAEIVQKQKDLSLNKYLRFEDHPYLNSQLNGIRLDSENDKKEYGFNQLKLVIAFLNWNNLKDDAHERIQSPLLLLPVELERKKSLKDERWTVKLTDNTAIVNPVLANFLKDLYNIVLPESISFDETGMEQFYALLKTQIEGARQGVQLTYIDKPRLRIIHSKARQIINIYTKRVAKRSRAGASAADYSYSADNYKPLGLELYRRNIEPQSSALEFLLNDPNVKPSSLHLAEVKTQDGYELSDQENNPYAWEFDVCNLVLGNFNYKKMSLVRDYNSLSQHPVEHIIFDELFSNQPRSPAAEPVVNDPAEWFHVITADPTQARSVLHARTGKSYIIQGPPGTGKSQTITNLVADFLANDKTVLFVCEKRAALDVVYHRLQQNRLSELCCYIHDSQSDKKEFIRDLKTVYDDFLKNKMDLASVRLKRKIVLERLLAAISELEHFHKEHQQIHPESGIATRALMDRVAALRDQLPDNPGSVSTPSYSAWIENGHVIHELATALDQAGSVNKLADHPFSKLGRKVIQADNPFLLLDDLVGKAMTIFREITSFIKDQKIPDEHTLALEQLKNLVQDSVLLEPLALTDNLKLVDASNSEARDFDRMYRQYKDLQTAYAQTQDTNKRWKNRFDPDETHHALALAQKHESSFFRFLNGNWRRLKKQLEQSYDFNSHQVKPTASSVLQNLEKEYAALDAFNRQRQDINRQYRVENPDMVNVNIEVLRRKKGDKEVDYLLRHPESNSIVLQLGRLQDKLSSLEHHLRQCLHNHEGKTVEQLQQELSGLNSHAQSLRELLPALKQFIELPGELQDFIREIPLSPVEAESLMADRTLQLFYQRNRQFREANQQSIRKLVNTIEEAYKELLVLNSELIRAEKRGRFLAHYQLSTAATAGLDAAQKLQKKEYSEGRRILEHEMGKSIRHKSIREMASNQSGMVLRDIKPVWLMSPLSVSDSLPLDPGFFDVVIFDEASQITLEEGIPALFRAPQAIIVGDDKQMPPSNFFNARTEDPDDLEMIDGESEDEILSSEADSLLVQGARKLDSTMLSWHYRSRYETLISYSNHAFYDAGLLTIPDRMINNSEATLTSVTDASELLVAAEKNAALLLSDSISYHHLPCAVYDNRSNNTEAKYIAAMIRKLLIDNVPESIGVVAFSQEQQGSIETAIDELAGQDKLFDELLEKAYNRRDEGQVTGLFVKNLENVQGDERDIIIMSVCYGNDSNGKMLMNFGPINKKGGEKRLNVIFSRAKKHMAVVSSIRHHQITNEHNDGANYFKRFLHYAEMVSTGNMNMARTILDSLNGQPATGSNPVSIPALSVIASQIKEALTGRGLLVDPLVGQSNFKCTLGVKTTTDNSGYCLGILVDEAEHYRNADLVEQYYQRPAILEAFGWKIINVYSKDWLDDRERVMAMILKNIGEAG